MNVPRSARARVGGGRLAWMLGWAGGLVAAPAVWAASLFTVTGVEDAMIAFGPVTPQVVAAPGATVAMRLNGSRYTGRPISEERLHTLVIEATGPDGTRQVAEVQFFLAAADGRAPRYVHALEHLNLRRVRVHPHVKPASSADENFIVGWTKGWPADPKVPAHELFGYRLTDPAVPDDRKVQIILSGGNHPREQTGSWALRGLQDFLLGDSAEAAELRRRVVFHIYPMVNPDGRFLSDSRSNPEMQAQGMPDHNRVWNTGDRFTTIGILTRAMQADTGGKVDILLDFHSAAESFFYSLQGMMDTPLARSITARDGQVLPRESAGHPGMIRIWAMTEAGLSAPVAYTPEIAGGATAVRALEIGRAYGQALHDLMTGASMLRILDGLAVERALDGFGEQARVELVQAGGRYRQALADPHPRTALVEANRLLEAVRKFEAMATARAQAEALMVAARAIPARTGEGFAALLGGALERRARAVAAVLATPAAGPEELAAAVESLATAVEACQNLAGASAAAPVTLREIRGQPATLTTGARADWEDGLLLGTHAGAEGLGLATRQALMFDGATSHVTTNFKPGVSTLGQQFTWEFWVRHQRFANNTGSSGCDDNPRFYTQLEGTDGTLRVGLGNRYWKAATLPAENTWYHIAVVYDQREVRTYLDGALVHTRTEVAFNGNNPNGFTIGRGLRGGRWLDGSTRDHRLWNVARSEVELRLNKDQSLTGSEPGLVAWWPLDEGRGNRAHDRASGRYHGTVRGAQWALEAEAGYRIAQPVRFADVRRVGSSRITWEAAGTVADGQSAVVIEVGTSDSATELPQRWHTATNGGPLPRVVAGDDLATRVFWFRQRLQPPAGDDSATTLLRRLQVTVE